MIVVVGNIKRLINDIIDMKQETVFKKQNLIMTNSKIASFYEHFIDTESSLVARIANEI